MYLELFVVLESENDPLEGVFLAIQLQESIGELVLWLVFDEKYYYCIVLIRYLAIQIRNLLWVAMRC